MKKLWTYIRISLIDSFQYRSDILLFTLASIAQPIVLLAVWLAIGASGGSLPISQAEFALYFLLDMIIQLGVSAWSRPFITNDIRLGRLSPFLLKPVPYILYQIGNNLGEKIVKFIFAVAIVGILVFLFKINFPVLSFAHTVIFFLSWVIAAIIYFLMDHCTGLAGFWFEDTESLDDIWGMALYLFSGRIIPIFVLPVLLQKVAFVLPFRYTLSFPIEIALNRLTELQIVQALGMQIVWLIIMICFYKLLWTRGLHKYSAVGA